MKRTLTALAITASVATLPFTGADAATKTVRVSDNKFTPKTTTVRRGTTVRWTFTGKSPHNVTGPGLKSGTKKRGSYSKRITRTVRYRCTIHPGMTGTIRVR